MPHSFVDLAALVNKLAPACSLSVDPISYVIIAVRVDVPAVSMIDVVLKLTLIDDVVDLFTYTLNSAVSTNLPNNELVVLTLAKLKSLIDRFRAVLNDILQL